MRDLAVLNERMKNHLEWLKSVAPNCFTEQKHVQEGTQERVYWHYGYAVALCDVLRFIGMIPTVESDAPKDKIPTDA